MTGCSVVSEFVNATLPAAPQRGNGGKPDLSPELLRDLLDYDPDTGVLTWRSRPVEMFADGGRGASWNTRYAGRPAFTALESGGYRHGDVFGRKHKAHRVAWAIYHGEWPAGEIDHINGDRADNRIANLRAVSNADNMRNRKRPGNNTSGVIGVSWRKGEGKWRAEIMADGRRQSLGYFDDFSAAVAARKAAEAAHGYHQNHGRG